MDAFTDDFARTVPGGWGGIWQGPKADLSSVADGIARCTTRQLQPRGDLQAKLADPIGNFDITYQVKVLEPPTVSESTVAIHKDLPNGWAYHLELVFRPNQPAHMQAPQSMRNGVKDSFPPGGNKAVDVHPGQLVAIRMLVVGTRFRTKVYDAGSPEPDAWTQDVQGRREIAGDGKVCVMFGHGEKEPTEHHWEVHDFSFAPVVA